MTENGVMTRGYLSDPYIPWMHVELLGSFRMEISGSAMKTWIGLLVSGNFYIRLFGMDFCFFIICVCCRVLI